MSLFTNIPRSDAIDAARIVISKTDNDRLPLPKHYYLRLLEMCLALDTVTFGDAIFEQYRGLAMGSPLSPVLACLFMETLETRHFTRIIGCHNIWLRYVDDVLVIVPRRTNLQDTLTRLNDIHPTIQFTLEMETDNRLPFLDVMIIRHDSQFQFTVYRKPTDRNNYIHYYSSHSERTKSGVVIGFFLRAHRICSKIHLQEEIDHIINAFLHLRYPHGWLMHKASKAQAIMTRQSPTTPAHEPPSSPTVTSRITVPTSQSAERLVPLMRQTGTQLVLTASTRIHDIVKDNPPRHTSSQSVVYNIPCGGCDRSYVGETGRGLDTRLKEHKTDMRNMTTSNAIVQHALLTGHRPDWTSAKVLHQGMNRTTRKALEMAEISTKMTINTHTRNTQWAPQTAGLLIKDWLPK